jgi:hypothetical protein
MDEELELQKLAVKHCRWAGIYYRAAAIAAVPPYALIPFLVPAGYGNELGLSIMCGSLACTVFLALGLRYEGLAKNRMLLMPSWMQASLASLASLANAPEVYCDKNEDDYEIFKDDRPGRWIPGEEPGENIYGLPLGL